MTADAVFPVLLSLRVSTLALAIVAPVGVCLALVQARVQYRLRRVVDALILLPLVLPPSVIGFFLVVVFGRRGVVGRCRQIQHIQVSGCRRSLAEFRLHRQFAQIAR